jgi:membrane protease subunit (stomatin/prohibitin family)
MKWISKEGKDMFNLQANAFDIAKGIREDLDMSILKDGLSITGFNIMSISYPEEIQAMITRTASHSMIGDMDKYKQVEMVDGIASGRVKGGGAAADMAGMMMGMNMASEMMKKVNEAPVSKDIEGVEKSNSAKKPNFCSNCGTKTGGGNFCSNCGEKL